MLSLFSGLDEELKGEEMGPSRHTADFRIKKSQVCVCVCVCDIEREVGSSVCFLYFLVLRAQSPTQGSHVGVQQAGTGTQGERQETHHKAAGNWSAYLSVCLSVHQVHIYIVVTIV